MSGVPRLSSGIFKSTQQTVLRECHRRYVEKHGFPHCESYGDPPTICFVPYDDGSRHGNFLPESYRAIVAHPAWRRRLDKVHTQAKRSLPRSDRPWRELDSSNSSDALLMNVFCYPGTLEDIRVLHLLGIDGSVAPEFGLKARVPLIGEKFDRTEVDMKLGNLLVESKLTESDFQAKAQAVVKSYRHFADVFDRRALPRAGERYLSYQLIRNVLAAHAHDCSFCVIADARRPDLMEAWYAVMRCVKPGDLRRRCKMLTWQELALVLPPKLQEFLDEKYGIAVGSTTTPAESDAWN
ncbi:MAG TPA: hypothetical protein VE994_08760 [Terriglobales bacterium]|nr:hypothetical protein [Terriglobales bacterium]